MKKIKETVKRFLGNFLYSLEISYKASPKFFIHKCILLMIDSVFAFTMAWAWKCILNAVTEQTQFTYYIIGLVALYLIFQIIQHLRDMYDSYVDRNYYDAIEGYRDNILMSKSSKIDLAFFDSASMQDKMSIAMAGYNAMTEIIWSAFGILSNIINVIIAFVIICRYNVVIGIVTLIIVLPDFIYNKLYAKHRRKLNEKLTRRCRLRDYYGELFSDESVKFEMKLNRFGNYIYDRYLSYWKEIRNINRKEDIKNSFIAAFMSVLNIFGDLLVILTSVSDVVSKKIGIGDLQYNMSMVGRLRGQFSQLMSSISGYIEYNTDLEKLKEFNNMLTVEERSGDKIPVSNPTITFENVTFSYPNTENHTLKNCSFTINPHEKVGLVGLNGSGKSTIVKLLFRFYDPDEGRILINGIDAREYDIYELRKLFGVLFQEYVKYDLTLREVIALSNYSEVDNDERLMNACRKSGFDAVIKDWDNGFDSYLGRTLCDDGKDLSGGQWQLLGLARAYFRDSDIVVLDEPSASLDPIAENRIFNQLYDYSEGKCSITISHRLSNTMKADKILVLENGAIKEQGSHDELMKIQGLYYRLFTLQAKRYE